MRMPNIGASLAAILVASTVLLATGPVTLAQESTKVQDDLDLSEVIVTARKKTERLQDVPISVSVFSSDAIERLNVTSVDELAKLTTGLTFDSDFGRLSDRPIIRGQATILGDTGVSYFIDDVYYPGTLLDLDLESVSSVQVVRGPQSALHGRNTYSGAILITTKPPSLTPKGTAKIEYAQFGQKRLSVGYSSPLKDDVFGISLSGTWYERTGVTDDLWRNKFNGQKLGDEESKTANFATYWTPNERFEMRTRLMYSSQYDGPPPLFLQGYEQNNIYPDNGNRRATITGDQFFPVANGPGSVYLGANRYYAGEIQPRRLDVDAERSLGVTPHIGNQKVLAALTMNFKFTEDLTGTYVGGLNRERSDSAYDFDYQSTSYGPFMTSSVGLRPRAVVGAPAGQYEYAVSTGAPAANFSSVGSGRFREVSHELRLRWQRENWDVLLGAFYLDYRSDSIFKQTPVASWGAQLQQSLGVLQARMQAACNTFFQNRAGFPNCTSVVRRATAANSAIVAFDNVANVWTTFEDSSGHSTIDNTAVFGGVTWKARDNLELGLEARSAREKQERLPGQQNSIAYLTTLVETTPFSSRTAVPYQQGKFDSFTPRFTARYDFSGSHNLYLNFAKGTKPGGLNNFRAEALGLGSYKEERLTSIEIGSKNQFFDNRLLLNAAIFSNQIKGYQLTESVVYPDGTPSTLIKNVGKVEIQGLELEVGYAPASIQGLNLSFNYSYTKTKIKEGLDANEGVLRDVADNGQLDCSLGLAPAYIPVVAAIRAANPLTITPAINICHNDTGTLYFGAFGSIAGRKLPRVPEHNINMAASYSQPLTGDWRINMGANVSYNSKKFVQVDNLAYFGEATLLNASLGVSNERYIISLWGKNLTDEDSVVSASRFTDATNQSLRAFFGMNRLPRQVGLSAAVKF
jgi:iron complex outermembrane recepter protein